jgi:hypothetical protein
MSDVLEVKRLPQDKPQLFSTLVTIVRENVGRVLGPALHPSQHEMTAVLKLNSR